MTDQAGILEKGLLAALELAAHTQWADLTLSEIAEAADLKLSDFHGVSDKDALAAHADSYFDKAMSEEGISADDSPRERLFDVIMLRFEAMEEYRAGLVSLMKFRDRTPSLLLSLPIARKRSAYWALVSAGLDNRSGAPTGLKSVAIGYVIDKAERAWRKETSADFARTMAALDKGLREAEERMERLQRFTGWGKTRQRQENTATEETKPEET